MTKSATDLSDPIDRIDPALDYLIPENPNQTYDMNVLIYSIPDGETLSAD